MLRNRKPSVVKPDEPQPDGRGVGIGIGDKTEESSIGTDSNLELTGIISRPPPGEPSVRVILVNHEGRVAVRYSR